MMKPVFASRPLFVIAIAAAIGAIPSVVKAGSVSITSAHTAAAPDGEAWIGYQIVVTGAQNGAYQLRFEFVYFDGTFDHPVQANTIFAGSSTFWYDGLYGEVSDFYDEDHVGGGYFVRVTAKDYNGNTIAVATEGVALVNP